MSILGTIIGINPDRNEVEVRMGEFLVGQAPMKSYDEQYADYMKRIMGQTVSLSGDVTIQNQTQSKQNRKLLLIK